MMLGLSCAILIQSHLTHWGRVTHICVSDLTIIGSDNGLSPCRRQAIIRTNAGILLIRPLQTNFSEILIEILIFSFKKMRFKVSSAKRLPFCLGLNVLTHGAILGFINFMIRTVEWIINNITTIYINITFSSFFQLFFRLSNTNHAKLQQSGHANYRFYHQQSTGLKYILVRGTDEYLYKTAVKCVLSIHPI